MKQVFTLVGRGNCVVVATPRDTPLPGMPQTPPAEHLAPAAGFVERQQPLKWGDTTSERIGCVTPGHRRRSAQGDGVGWRDAHATEVTARLPGHLIPDKTLRS